MVPNMEVTTSDVKAETEIRKCSSPVVRVFGDVGDEGGVGEDESFPEDSRASRRTRGFPRLIRIGVGVVGLLLLRQLVTFCLNNGEISPWKKGEEGPVLVVDGWCVITNVNTPFQTGYCAKTMPTVVVCDDPNVMPVGGSPPKTS